MSGEVPAVTEADEPVKCTHCGVSLLSEPIPEDIRHMYAGNWFKREVGHYSLERDRTMFFLCPNCKGKL
jgi:DNA-directed RNA polymerase subunit RPC12/RpoP